MANFATPLLNATVTTTYRSAGVISVNTTTSNQRRIQIYEIEFGQSGALASTDIQNQWDVSRFTVTNLVVGTAVIANPLDNADVVALTQYLNNVNTEVSAMAVAGSGLSLKNWGINQRGSYRWRALDDGDNIMIPATAGFGIAIRELTGSASAIGSQTAVGTVSFIER